MLFVILTKVKTILQIRFRISVVAFEKHMVNLTNPNRNCRIDK